MAEESLTTVLGFEAAGAIATLKALTTSITQYNAALATSASTTKAHNRVAQGTARQFKTQAAALKGLGHEQDAMVARSRKSAQALTAVELRAQRTTAAARKLATATSTSSKQMILSWQSVIRIFTIQVIHQAITRITGALLGSAAAARKFEISISEVETIAGTVGLQFDELAAKAIEAATAIGQPLDVVVEAQYQLLSNQVGAATQSFLAFEASQRLSLAAVTPLNSAVALITGTLNAYGASAAGSDVLSAKLFKTVELGRVRINELGDSLGRVTVLGAELGISIDEILASIATLTIQGVKASDAMTQILNVQLKLIRPTDALKESMAELGISSAEAGIQAFGFQGFLQKLRDTTDGTASSLGELFGRVRATRGVLGATGKAAEKYAKNLEEIKNATSELLDEKLDLIFRTNAKQVEIELNRLNIQITENFGRGLNTLLKETFDVFGGATETLGTFATAATAAGIAFLTIRSGILFTIPNIIGLSVASDVATKKLIILRTASISTTLSIRAMTAATLAFIATPLGAAIAAAAAVTAIAFAYNRAQAASKEFFDDLKEHNERALKDQLKRISQEFSNTSEAYKEQLSEKQKQLTSIVKLELEASKKTEIIEKAVNASISEQLQNRANAVQAYASGASAIVDELHSKLKSLRDDSRSIQETIESFKFERKTRGMESIEKFYANIERSQSLRFKSQAAIRKGEIELGKTLNAQANTYADQALSSADASKNTAAIRKAEQQKEKVLNDQLVTNRNISRQEISRAAVAEKAASGLFSRTQLLKSLVDQHKDLGSKLADIKTTDDERKVIIREQLNIARQLTGEATAFSKRWSEAVTLGLEEPFNNVVRKFREPLTGIKVDLSEAIIFDALVIAKTLQVALTEAQKTTKLETAAIAGLPEDATGTQIAQELTKANQELEKYGKSLIDTTVAQNTIQTLWASTHTDTIAVTNELRAQDRLWTKAVRFARGGESITPIGFDPAITQIDTLSVEINNLIQSGGDLGEINKKLLELRGIDLALVQNNLFSTSNKMGILIASLEAGRDALKEVNAGREFTLSPVISEFERFGSVLKTETSKLNTFFDLLKTGGQDANLPTIRLNTPQERSMGGLIHRQFGGFIPRGTDTVPAMLSPGEFVVNAKSANRFASQLVAMNSGTQPIYREKGGPVTNIGDVSITVPGAETPPQTARAIMDAFRRETRRRT